MIRCKYQRTTRKTPVLSILLILSNSNNNSNIDCSHLNYRGLHLNRDGSALLQNNIANILKAKD